MKFSAKLYNKDIAPVPVEQRTWTLWNFAALWVGMAISIPAYVLAASLMEQGMNWWQALLTIALGNTLVLIPMLLNAHAGAKYGIPFPVFLRSSFGVLGANVPALMRALVACGWFGIQTWIGGAAMYTMTLVAAKSFDITLAGTVELLPVLGITGLQFVCFIVFWFINIAVILRGIDCIKWLENWSAPFLLAVGLGLLAWGVTRAGGFGVVFSSETVNRVRNNNAAFSFWQVFFPLLTGMVGYWATVALNILDFTRYARSQRDQVLGQLISLPTTMTLFSFIGVAVTAATVVIFGEPIWDPVTLLAKFESPLIVMLSLLGLVIATLSTNIAANVVSPANSFSNLMPDRISFRAGGIITGIIGIVIMPWKLLSDLGAYVFTWLIGYGALLGAIAGVMLADYYLVRRTALNVDALYRIDGEYAYGGSGVNWRALAAMLTGAALNVPGFLQSATHGSIQVAPFFNTLYTYAWFVSLFVAAGLYWFLTVFAPAAQLSGRKEAVG